MKLIEKIRTNNIYKFLFYIFLLLIIFNQVISYTEFIQESISEIFKKKSK
jgi:hypothetical protein